MKNTLKTCISKQCLDEAVLCGLGLHPDSAHIVMSHINSLTRAIKPFAAMYRHGDEQKHIIPVVIGRRGKCEDMTMITTDDTTMAWKALNSIE